MDQHIKPIETAYNGYRFRSRLEARWACFFDALSIQYEYEKEGFELPGGLRYLPDFYLPDSDTWIEIKGQEPDETEQLKAGELAGIAVRAGRPRQPVYIFAGPVWLPDLTVYHAVSWRAENEAKLREYTQIAIERKDPYLLFLIRQGADQWYWRDLLEYAFHEIGEPPMGWVYYLEKGRPYSATPQQLYLCPECGRLVVGFKNLATLCEYCGQKATADDPRLLSAFQAARSARFEHGESGARR